jgi:hypothetical protein
LVDSIGLADPERDWRDDYKPCSDDGMAAAGLDYSEFQYRESLESLTEWVESNGTLQRKLDLGYEHEEAVLLKVFGTPTIGTAIGTALAEGSPRYSALTHAGYNVLARKAAAGEVAPKCYAVLCAVESDESCVGRADSLESCDARWLRILEPDDTGFQGFTR